MVSVLNYLVDLGSLGEVLLAVILLSSVVLEIYHLISPVRDSQANISSKRHFD